MDIDAGPILFELSPSGTAFMTGAATYFNDSSVRKDILRTAEFAGHSVRHNGKRHYLLANVALVGESIMLLGKQAYFQMPLLGSLPHMSVCCFLLVKPFSAPTLFSLVPTPIDPASSPSVWRE